jgi:signal transduction histidine kinase
MLVVLVFAVVMAGAYYWLVHRPQALANEMSRVEQRTRHNIVKHANVDRAVLRMDSENGSLHIEVEDDGVGFRTEPLPPREGQIGGFGLFSFRERVRQIGGSLSIESNPDRGCLVTVVIPLKAGSEVRREEIESR